MSRTIRELQEVIHSDNRERGWWDSVDLPLLVDSVGARSLVFEKLMLAATELSEAVEDVRNGATLNAVEVINGKPCGFPTEIADAVIRLLDLGKACDIDLGGVIEQKLAYNRTRGHRHGGRLA